MPGMRALRATLLLFLAGISTAAWAQPIAIPVGPRPESVTRGWGGSFYVSIQGTPDPGDGEIRRLDLPGGAVTPFVAGLNDPRGITFTGEFLVVTDTTRVWIVDQQGNARVLAEAAAFPHPIEFLNDAAAEPGGRSVLVTEMGARSQIRDPATQLLWPLDSFSATTWTIEARSRIYRVTLDGAVAEVVSPSRKLLVINGVGLANRPGHLLAVDFFFGSLVEIKPGRRPTRTTLATGFRGADGVEQDAEGNIYVSTFENGAVWKLDRDGETVQVLLSGVGPRSTADFYLDEPGHRLLVPHTANGTILLLPTE